MRRYELDIRNSFEKAPKHVQDAAMEITANFHFRDMKKYEDGSIGTIEISPKQLNDCLAYMAGLKS